MIHAVKTALGTYKAVKDGGTHVIMSCQDYHDTVELTRMLKSDIQQSARESVKLHRQISDDAERISSLQSQLATVEKTANGLSCQRDELEQSISVFKEDLAKIKDDLAHAQALNVNLQRICRERANQVRDLPKSSDGYIVLVSQEWREKAQNGQLIRGYKTTIQSPHDAGMDATTAKRQIFEDLVDGVLSDLGCLYYEKINGRPAVPIEELSMYRWIYTADFRSGFWTVTIYTTGPLTVPPHRKPQQKRNRRGTQDGKSEFRSNAEESTEKGS